jgi:hypothetical protein
MPVMAIRYEERKAFAGMVEYRCEASLTRLAPNEYLEVREGRSLI